MSSGSLTQKKHWSTVQMYSFAARTDISTRLLLLQSQNIISMDWESKAIKRIKLSFIQQNLPSWKEKVSVCLQTGPSVSQCPGGSTTARLAVPPTPLSPVCNKTNYSQTRISGSHALHFASDWNSILRLRCFCGLDKLLWLMTKSDLTVEAQKKKNPGNVRNRTLSIFSGEVGLAFLLLPICVYPHNKSAFTI